MLRVGKTRPLLGHSCIGSISAKKTSSWHASTHHGVQQGRKCAGHLAKTRHGAYLKYTQNIVLQHQGEDPMRKPATPYLQQCLSGDIEERYHQPIDRSGLTPASYLQQSMGQRECKRYTQNTIFPLTGCSAQQTCRFANQQC
ncbi:hypothetical protein TNCV_4438661 [Trichonephila clavipes]|nr:hypothetical protein TNCV_4438661 [Trichonephila clavipes]